MLQETLYTLPLRGWRSNIHSLLPPSSPFTGTILPSSLLPLRAFYSRQTKRNILSSVGWANGCKNNHCKYLSYLFSQKTRKKKDFQYININIRFCCFF